jgi:hypothetical protein
MFQKNCLKRAQLQPFKVLLPPPPNFTFNFSPYELCYTVSAHMLWETKYCLFWSLWSYLFVALPINTRARNIPDVVWILANAVLLQPVYSFRISFSFTSNTILRMATHWIPRRIFNYHPKGRREIATKEMDGSLRLSGRSEQANRPKPCTWWWWWWLPSACGWSLAEKNSVVPYSHCTVQLSNVRDI